MLIVAAAASIVGLVVATPQREPLPRSSEVNVSAHVVITPLVPAVERPVHMPITIAATRLVSEPPSAVAVAVCPSYPCAGVDDTRVVVDDAPVTIDAVVWPPGLQARVTVNGAQQWIGPQRRATRVVAAAGRTDDPYVLRYGENGSDGEIVVVPVGALFDEHPEIVPAFGAIIVTSHDAALEERARAAGVIVVDEAFDRSSAINELVRRPGFLHFLDASSIDELPVVHAAAAGLAVRPPRTLAFVLALAAILAIAVLVRRGGKSGNIGRALLSSTGVAFGTAAALFALQVFVIERETHVRVVAWTGPDAAWETGADAVRPRDTAHVVATTPIAPSGVTLVGTHDVSDAHTTTTGAEATVPSSAGLVAVWERPAATPNAVRYVSDDVVENRLDQKLDLVAFDGGNRYVTNVAAHGRADRNDARSRDYGVRAFPDVQVAEERLLFEIMNTCNRRAPAEHAMCTAAVTRESDGTILGIEVTR